MKIICIIPARGGSKGIKHKNLQALYCQITDEVKSLISISVEQAVESEHISEVYVTSDDEEILEDAKSSGAIPIKRPKNISTDSSPSEEALIHCLKQIKTKPDIVVFLQATSPLRYVSDIDDAISLFIQKDYDSLFSAVKTEDTFMWNIDKKGILLNSSNYDYANRKRRQDITNQIIENGSIYIFKPKILKKYRNRLGDNIGYYLMEKWQVHEIDIHEDLELCEFLYYKKIYFQERQRRLSDQYEKELI